MFWPFLHSSWNEYYKLCKLLWNKNLKKKYWDLICYNFQIRLYFSVYPSLCLHDWWFTMVSHQMVILTWKSEYFLRKSVVKFLRKIFRFNMKMIGWGGKILHFNANPVLPIRDLQWIFCQWHDESCCISSVPVCNKLFSVSIHYNSSSEFNKVYLIISVNSISTTVLL